MADLIQDLQVCLSWELPHSAIPLCHLLPCHLGPPRPMLSINLHVKGSIDCTIGAFHMSIPAEPFLLQNEVQCKHAQLAHWTWWCERLVAWHCRSVWSLPCQYAADIGGLALSMVNKSYWHGALHSTHNTCTHGHVSWKRGGGKKEPVATPWTSSRRFSHVLWLKVHSRRQLRAFLLGRKMKLPPPACQVQLWLPYVVCCPRGVQFPGTVYICNQGPLPSTWSYCISCTPSACSHCRRFYSCPLQCERQHMKLAWTLQEVQARTTDHDPSFLHLLSPFYSIASFQVKIFLTPSLSDSAMITRSLV